MQYNLNGYRNKLRNFIWYLMKLSQLGEYMTKAVICKIKNVRFMFYNISGDQLVVKLKVIKPQRNLFFYKYSPFIFLIRYFFCTRLYIFVFVFVIIFCSNLVFFRPSYFILFILFTKYIFLIILDLGSTS